MPSDHAPRLDLSELERRNRELSILNVIADALNREVDLTRALRAVLIHVAELLNLHTSWIFLIDEETGKFYPAASHNLPPALADKPRRMAGTCHCLDTYEEGDLDGAANVNIIKCSRLSGLVDGTDGLRYHASIPLYAYGKQLGVLNVASADWQELSPQDLRLLYTVGDLLSIAIERARLFARSAQFGAMEERNRLAREIHDTLAQGLAGIALQLEAADAHLDAGDDSRRAQTAIRRALNLTRSNLEEARRSVLDLRAAPLEGRTLAEAIRALVEEQSGAAKLAHQFEMVGGERPLPVRVEAGMYRIAQEAIANVIRHAGAKHVVVQLIATSDAIRLVVEDDGRGFDPSAIPSGHFGLIGLNERVRLLGGTLDLRSSPDAGTHLEVTVPLE